MIKLDSSSFVEIDQSYIELLSDSEETHITKSSHIFQDTLKNSEALQPKKNNQEIADRLVKSKLPKENSALSIAKNILSLNKIDNSDLDWVDIVDFNNLNSSHISSSRRRPKNNPQKKIEEDDNKLSHESTLYDFLNLNTAIQEKKIKKSYFLPELTTLIKNSDQKKTYNKNGEILFLLLLKSKVKEIRNLAFICLEDGADINVTNNRGETALHLAAINGDEALIAKLIEKGAAQNKKTYLGAQTTIEYALNHQHHACALFLASQNHELQPEAFIDLFIAEVDIKEIIILLEKKYSNETIQAHGKKIWNCIYDNLIIFQTNN